MPKVEFQTKQTERFKLMLALVTDKYGAYLDPQQAADAIGYTRWTVYQLIQSGRLRATHSKGKTGKISVSAYDLVKFMEKNATGTR